jgi:SAM-dependent methyltransferase
MSPAATYTPGHSAAVTAFMARRSVDSHAAFVLPHLRPSDRVLDVGCGPGTITIGLAARVPEGSVLGLDLNAGQVECARILADERGCANASFEVGAIESVNLPEASFDLVFAHAVFEHLSAPVAALRRIRRWLRPGGRVALRSPEWGGLVVHPGGPEVDRATEAYAALQRGNGGNLRAGRELGFWLAEAGFELHARSASYQIYEEPALIAFYLAEQLEAKGAAQEGATLRRWAQAPHALFAQAWFEAIGVKR